jgi:hypothetical protein
MKKTELYEDVLLEEPKFSNRRSYKKEYDDWEKRLHKSIGWLDLMEQDKVYLDLKGKIVSDPLGEGKLVYDVKTEDGGMTCEKQEDAVIYSLLLQMNERIKKIERVIMNDKKYNISHEDMKKICRVK